MTKKLNVVIYTGGYDTGGQGYRLKRAFDMYYPEEFNVRSVHSSDNYFHYPSDLIYRPREVYPIFQAADVIHMRNGLEGLKRLRPDALEGGVGLVCHWHGTRFRTEHKTLHPQVAAAGATQIVSTIDLALLESGLTWLPSPINMDAMWRIKANAKERAKDAPIRVAHAPTNRLIKSTAEVMDAILTVNTRSHPIVLDLIEKQRWATVLERKALADIYVDQLKLGYGNNALEAWAMRIPVIAGVSDPLVHQVMLETFRDIPFFEASQYSIAARLEEMATDSDLRSQWADMGLEHVARFHDDRKVAEQLAGIYRTAYERKVAHAAG